MSVLLQFTPEEVEDIRTHIKGLPLVLHRLDELEKSSAIMRKVLFGNGKIGLIAKVWMVVSVFGFLGGVAGTVLAAFLASHLW